MYLASHGSVHVYKNNIREVRNSLLFQLILHFRAFIMKRNLTYLANKNS